MREVLFEISQLISALQFCTIGEPLFAKRRPCSGSELFECRESSVHIQIILRQKHQSCVWEFVGAGVQLIDRGARICSTVRFHPPLFCGRLPLLGRRLFLGRRFLLQSRAWRSCLARTTFACARMVRLALAYHHLNNLRGDARLLPHNRDTSILRQNRKLTSPLTIMQTLLSTNLRTLRHLITLLPKRARHAGHIRLLLVGGAELSTTTLLMSAARTKTTRHLHLRLVPTIPHPRIASLRVLHIDRRRTVLHRTCRLFRFKHTQYVTQNILCRTTRI